MLSSLVVYSYLLMLIVGMVVPSDGNHGFWTPKSLTFISAAFFFCLYALTNWKISLPQCWAALIMLAALLFFGVWFVVGSLHVDQYLAKPFDQFKVFLITLFVPLSAWYLVKDGLLSIPTILRTVIISHSVYCALKIGLTLLHLTGVINLWALMKLTDLRFMSMQISGDLSRIQTSTDTVTPFLTYFVLQSNSLNLNFSKKFKTFFLIVAAFSTFLSFSRFLLFAFGFAVLLYAFTLKLRSQIKVWIGCIVLVVTAYASIGPERLNEVIERRFFSQETGQSDAVRQSQIEALLDGCDAQPVLGYGLGGYAADCIRDGTLPHNYEVQWVAFLMQFGMVGFPLLLAPCFFLIGKLLLPHYQISYILLFGLWLSSGLTNPFLISLTSGIVYTIFLLASETHNKYIRLGAD